MMLHIKALLLKKLCSQLLIKVDGKENKIPSTTGFINKSK